MNEASPQLARFLFFRILDLTFLIFFWLMSLKKKFSLVNLSLFYPVFFLVRLLTRTFGILPPFVVSPPLLFAFLLWVDFSKVRV